MNKKYIVYLQKEKVIIHIGIICILKFNILSREVEGLAL